MKFNLLTYFAFIFAFNFVKCASVFSRIYENIQSELACIKRLNGTHEIGCTSSFWGNVGIIHVIESMDNLTWLIDNAAHPPYILAVMPELFTVEFLNVASRSGKISGIVLFASDNYTSPSTFSGEQSCPNRQNSLYLNTSYESYCEKQPWNPYGSSLLFMNWDFPIFLLTDDKSINVIISCFDTFNNPNKSEDPYTWPFCAIELNSNMYASISSEVCLRRTEVVFTSVTLCEPLEDINIWGSTNSLHSSNEIPENSVIILSTSADAASLFNALSPGADAAITGLVTLLVTAEALFKHHDSLIKNSDKNILFTIFEGEAWNYIGSSRMVYDMANNKFPYETIKGQLDQMNQLNLSHIHSLIDLKQVGLMMKSNGAKKLFVHSDPLSNINPDTLSETDNIINILVSESSNWNLTLNTVSKENPLPPSSLQSFLKTKNISGVVISDHEQEFENKYYMSIYDNSGNLKFKYSPTGPSNEDTLHKDIAQLASIISSSLYKIATGSEKRIKADENITNELLYCFLHNMNCSYFQENSDAHLKKFLEPAPARTFVSVKRADSPLTVLTLRILSRYMGKEVNINETNCKSNNTQSKNLVYFPYINNGTCFETSVHHSSALSPAFIIKDYDWTSDEYSTWTESTWSLSKARIFLIPSPKEEIVLIICGVISILLSFLMVHIVNSKAKVIFASEIIPTPC